MAFIITEAGASISPCMFCGMWLPMRLTDAIILVVWHGDSKIEAEQQKVSDDNIQAHQKLGNQL